VEDAAPVVVKFYRPERWSDAAILEEHAFTAELAAREIPVVAEYWSADLGALEWFLTAVGDRMMLFDVPLHFAFHRAGIEGDAFDLRTIFDRTLVAARHDMAVTFVDNHDSQPMQALESTVADWFKPLAYALILLRREGFPCVFQADYDGAAYTEQRWGEEPVDVEMASHRAFLDVCLGLRRDLGESEQADAFDHSNVIGWIRHGDGVTVVVLMSNGGDGAQAFATGLPDASTTTRVAIPLPEAKRLAVRLLVDLMGPMADSASTMPRAAMSSCLTAAAWHELHQRRGSCLAASG
jgi:alpha-amylase